MALVKSQFASGLPIRIAPDYMDANRFVLPDGSKYGVLPDGRFLAVIADQNPELTCEVFHKNWNFIRNDLGYEMHQRVLAGQLGEVFVFVKGLRVIVGCKNISLSFFDFPAVKELTVTILPGTFASECDAYFELPLPDGNKIQTIWKMIDIRGVRVMISERAIVMQPAVKDMQ